MRTAIEHRIIRFQELINKGKIYKLMNFNLYILQMCFKKGKGTYVPLNNLEYNNYLEDYVFYCN